MTSWWRARSSISRACSSSRSRSSPRSTRGRHGRSCSPHALRGSQPPGRSSRPNRAYEIADVRYGAGVSTQLELSDARVQRQQAEANRALAARDLQVARARVALLPDLPVGNALPGAAAPSSRSAVRRAPSSSRAQGGGQSEMRPRNSRSHRQELDEYTVVPGIVLLNLAVISASCSQSVEGEGAAPAPLAVQIGAENVVSVEVAARSSSVRSSPAS